MRAVVYHGPKNVSVDDVTGRDDRTSHRCTLPFNTSN